MIPFNRPSFQGNELSYLEKAIENGSISGNGDFTKKAERMLSDLHGGATALLTTNCTHALEMAARLMDLQVGDEVIVPSYTFVSTASAFMWNGARPVFADSRPDTLNINPDHVERLITPRTKAICIVHYAGVGADPRRFVELAQRHNITLIEDNAHGLGGQFEGGTLGTFGAMSTLSFHETKNITCGEGGALVLNDPRLIGRAEILREKGTDRSRFLRGQVDKYTWTDVGSSWVMSDLLAAVLVGQLERFSEIQNNRIALWDRYEQELADWAESLGVIRPQIPDTAKHTGHMYYLRFNSNQRRDAFIEHMRSRGVTSVFHYQALHRSLIAQRLGEQPACSIADETARTLVRLPMFNNLPESDQATVITAALAFS